MYRRVAAQWARGLLSLRQRGLHRPTGATAPTRPLTERDFAARARARAA